MATIILEHSDLTGSELLGRTLRDHGHRLEVLRLHRGDPVPDDLDGIDAVVCCGGPQSPLDDEPGWMAPQLRLLEMAHAAALPVVGLCLGSQLLARALGGEVTPCKEGVECGWHEVRLTPAGREDPLFAGCAWRSRQMQWHRFEVAVPPKGGRVLATSDHSPVQAWALGLRTYGIQFHPESSARTIGLWGEDEPETLREADLTAGQLRTETEACHPAAARLAQRLFERMALVLMPLDRRYAGVAKDLHH